jgi:hypothetical protein
MKILAYSIAFIVSTIVILFFLAVPIAIIYAVVSLFQGFLAIALTFFVMLIFLKYWFKIIQKSMTWLSIHCVLLLEYISTMEKNANLE